MAAVTANVAARADRKFVATHPFGDPEVADDRDALVIRFPVLRQWVVLAAFGGFLPVFTAFGIPILLRLFGFADAPPGRSEGDLLLDAGIWAFGESILLVVLATQFGSYVLTVTWGDLEARRQIGPFGSTHRYRTPLVRNVYVRRHESRDDEGAVHVRFYVEVLYEGSAVALLPFTAEEQANWVASLLRARIRPEARWSEARAPVSTR